MKLIKHEKTLPDGRKVSYHRVTELNIDTLTTTMVVLLGSWETAAGANSQGRPDAVFAISMQNDAGHREAILENVIALPEWSGAKIVNE